MAADVFSEEGKHHMGCWTVKANNRPHPWGPRRKSSTNECFVFPLTSVTLVSCHTLTALCDAAFLSSRASVPASVCPACTVVHNSQYLWVFTGSFHSKFKHFSRCPYISLPPSVFRRCAYITEFCSLFYSHVFLQQKEEGKVQGQLNHTDSSQYIRDLKDQIAELKHEVRCVKHQGQ